MGAATVSATTRADFGRVQVNDTPVPPRSGASDQGSLNLLTRLAEEEVLTDENFLGKTRFRFDQKNHTFSYDFTPVPANLVLADGDRHASVLEALIRIEALRRDFLASIPDEKFWLAPLNSAEEIVNRCVQSLETSESKQNAAVNQPECYDKIQDQFDILRASVLAFAAAHKLELVEPPRTRDPVPGYRVNIKIEPPRARLRVMTLLEYKKYQYFKTPKEQYRWKDVLDSENLMIGWYHYRAEWPQELNGAEEGDFEINKATNLTFKPPQK